MFKNLSHIRLDPNLKEGLIRETLVSFIYYSINKIFKNKKQQIITQ
jgi:hypothetical protein